VARLGRASLRPGLRLFREVVRTRWGSRIARRGAFALASVVAQTLLAVFLVATHHGAAIHEAGPVVDVKFIRTRPPGPAVAALPTHRRPAPERPKVAPPRLAIPPVIQPKTIAPTHPVVAEPRPSEATPPAEATAVGGAESAGAGNGIVGGIPGADSRGAFAATIAERPRVDFDETMTAPKFLDGPSIEYSAEALQQGVEGLMIVRCVVTVEGAVYGCRVLKSLPLMDEAVVAVLQARRYRPALLKGMPLEVNYTFRIRLRLPR